MTQAGIGAIYSKLLAGHILMGIDRKKLSSWLTPGEMAHAALCIMGCGRVAEMVGEGFQYVDADDFCRHYDRVLLLECDDWDDDYIGQVLVPVAHEFRTTTYDHAFRPGAKCLYCFELIEAVDTEHRLQLVYESLLGRKLVTGDSILKAPNVRVVVDTDHLPTVAQGA